VDDGTDVSVMGGVVVVQADDGAGNSVLRTSYLSIYDGGHIEGDFEAAGDLLICDQKTSGDPDGTGTLFIDFGGKIRTTIRNADYLAGGAGEWAHNWQFPDVTTGSGNLNKIWLAGSDSAGVAMVEMTWDDTTGTVLKLHDVATNSMVPVELARRFSLRNFSGGTTVGTSGEEQLGITENFTIANAQHITGTVAGSSVVDIFGAGTVRLYLTDGGSDNVLIAECATGSLGNGWKIDFDIAVGNTGKLYSSCNVYRDSDRVAHTYNAQLGLSGGPVYYLNVTGDTPNAAGDVRLEYLAAEINNYVIPV
jgi:hypothetical protein